MTPRTSSQTSHGPGNPLGFNSRPFCASAPPVPFVAYLAPLPQVCPLFCSEFTHVGFRMYEAAGQSNARSVFPNPKLIPGYCLDLTSCCKPVGGHGSAVRSHPCEGRSTSVLAEHNSREEWFRAHARRQCQPTAAQQTCSIDADGSVLVLGVACAGTAGERKRAASQE